MSLSLTDREGNRRIVKVYQDPLICKDFEGDALLMKLLDADTYDRNLEYWEVIFIQDLDDRTRYKRFINRKYH